MLNSISALPEGVRLFVDVAAKGLLALAVAGAINAALPRLSAARRHMVWLLALLSLIAVPALALVGPTWRVALLPKRAPAPELPRSTAEREPAVPGGAEAAAVGTPEIPLAPVPPGVESAESSRADLPAGALKLSLAPVSQSARPIISPLPLGRPEVSLVWPWLVGVWAAGLACALAGPLVGLVVTARVARIARSSRARPRESHDGGRLARLLAEVRGEMSVRREVPLAFAGPGAVPMALGLFRPVLLLPDEAPTWPDRRARAVLRHELAHVLRRDCLTHFLARVACALHWFNPLAWLALRQLRALQERACDDRVLACGVKASDYAEDLLAVATSRTRTAGRTRWRLRDLACPTVGLAMARKGNPSTLRARLSALLDPRRGRRPAGAAARAAAALALLALPPFSALRVARTADAARHQPRPKAAPSAPPASPSPSDDTGGWETLAENRADEAGAKPLRDARDESALKRMAELERQLGGRDIHGFQNWNSKKQMMSRLIEEKLHIMAEIEGYKTRLANLNKDLSEGRTPADVETTIRNTGTYNSFRMKVIDYDIDLQQVQHFMGEHANQVVALQEVREFWRKKAEQEHEELKKTLSEGRKAEYESEVKASKANLGRIEELISTTAKELGELNQAMNEYTWLGRSQAAANWRRAGATFTKAVKVDGATTVTVAHGPTDQETRVVAVTADGEEIPPSSQDVQSAGGVSQTTATFRGLAPKRIQSFRFQVRSTRRAGAAAPAPAKTTAAEPPPAAPAAPAAVAARDKNDALAMTLAEALEALSPGGELDAEAVRARQAELDLTLRALNEARESIKQAQEEREKAEQEGGRKPSADDFARVDPEMAAQVRARSEEQLRYDTLRSQLGDTNAAVHKAQTALQARTARMQAYADQLNDKFVIRWKVDGSGGALISKDLSVQENSAKRLEELYNQQAAEMAKLRRRRAQAMILVEQFRAKEPAGTTTRPALP